MCGHAHDLEAAATDRDSRRSAVRKAQGVGVDYVFANSGTDFPPIIEGLIEAGHNKGIDLPTGDHRAP